MKKIISLLLVLSFSYGFVYEFKAKNGYNKEINFAKFENDVLVIFKSTDGFKTNENLQTLNKIYNQYKENNIYFVGFAIKKRNFDTNDFCVLNYGVDFDMIGITNNKLSKLENYISHIYGDGNLRLYAPILIYNREIIKLSNIDELKNKLSYIFYPNK